MNYETIKLNFEKHLWTVAMVRFAVHKGVITPAQFKEITGENY